MGRLFSFHVCLICEASCCWSFLLGGLLNELVGYRFWPSSFIQTIQFINSLNFSHKQTNKLIQLKKTITFKNKSNKRKRECSWLMEFIGMKIHNQSPVNLNSWMNSIEGAINHSTISNSLFTKSKRKWIKQLD